MGVKRSSGSTPGIGSNPTGIYAFNFNYQTGTTSTSAYAFKGVSTIPHMNVAISHIIMNGTIVSGATYQGAIFTVSGTTVATIELTDTVVASAAQAGGVTMFTAFATPIELTAGTEYFIAVGRTDGGDTYALPIVYPSSPVVTFPFAYLGTNESGRIAKAAPAVSDTVNFNTSTPGFAVMWRAT